MSDHWGAPRQPEPDQPEILSDQPTAPEASPAYSAAGTFLPAQPPESTGGKRKWVAGGVAVLLVAGVGVGAAYAAGALGGGGGKQPEAEVPSTSVAFVSFDLNPSLGQKVDALRFLRKFPSAKILARQHRRHPAVHLRPGHQGRPEAVRAELRPGRQAVDRQPVRRRRAARCCGRR